MKNMRWDKKVIKINIFIQTKVQRLVDEKYEATLVTNPFRLEG